MTKYLIALMFITVGAGYMFYELRHYTPVDHNKVVAEIKQHKDTETLNSWAKNVKEKDKVVEETPVILDKPEPVEQPEAEQPVEQAVEQPAKPAPLPDRKPKVTKVVETPPEVVAQNTPPPREHQAPVEEWNPGCTPKHDTPEAVTSYFRSYNQPLPQQYCQEAPHEAQTPPPHHQEQAPPPEQQEQAPPPEQQEQAPPEDQLDGGPPDEQQAPPPQEEQQAPPPHYQEQAPPPPVHGHIWHGPPAPNSQTPECGYWNNFCGQEAPVPGGAGGYPPPQAQIYVQPRGFVLRSPWANIAIPFFRNGFERRQQRRAYRQWRRNQY